MDDIANVVMSVGKQSQRFVFFPSQKYVHVSSSRLSRATKVTCLDPFILGFHKVFVNR